MDKLRFSVRDLLIFFKKYDDDFGKTYIIYRGGYSMGLSFLDYLEKEKLINNKEKPIADAYFKYLYE